MKTLLAETLKDLKVCHVAKVYQGKNDGCRCGCKGKYTYTSSGATESYHKVNDKAVQSAITKALNIVLNGEHWMDDSVVCGNYINVAFGENEEQRRAITFYYK